MSKQSPKLKIDQNASVAPAAHEGATTVTLLDEKRRYSLRIKQRNVTAVEAETGISLPAKIGATEIFEGVSVYCLGPDEWLLVSDTEVDIAGKFADAPAPFSLVDISHRNVALELNGPAAAALINVGCPLDLSLGAFPVGKVTRTVFERAEIILHRINHEKFQIEVWRSFAPYLLRILEKNAV